MADSWFPALHVESSKAAVPVLTTPKNWTNWKSTTLLRSIKELRHWANCCPKTQLLKPKPRSRNPHRNQERNRRINCNWQDARKLKTPGRPSLRGSPHFCELYHQELSQVLTEDCRKLLLQQQRERNETILKCAQSSLFFSTKYY